MLNYKRIVSDEVHSELLMQTEILLTFKLFHNSFEFFSVASMHTQFQQIEPEPDHWYLCEQYAVNTGSLFKFFSKKKQILSKTMWQEEERNFIISFDIIHDSNTIKTLNWTENPRKELKKENNKINSFKD